MIRASLIAACIATLLSVALHVLLSLGFQPDADIAEEEGGATTAMLGNSFQDIVGAMTPSETPAESVTADSPNQVERSEPPREALDPNAAVDIASSYAPNAAQRADAPQTARAPDSPKQTQSPSEPTSAAAVPTSEQMSAEVPSFDPMEAAALPEALTPSAPSAQSLPVAERSVLQSTQAPPILATQAQPVPSVAIVAPAPVQQVAPTAALTPPVRAAQPALPTPTLEASPPVDAEKTLESLPEVATGPAPNLSSRPAMRPRAIEEAGEARAAAAREAAAARRAAQQQQARQTRQSPSQTQAQQRGSDQGQAAGRAATSTAQSGTAARAGNAAAANYPGLVNRAISRVRRPSMSAKGRVVVTLSIASSGALAGIRIARSSGNARMDQAAVQMIRRARFPKPPPGAQTTFSKTIKWE